jgi:hypothetical protein
VGAGVVGTAGVGEATLDGTTVAGALVEGVPVEGVPAEDPPVERPPVAAFAAPRVPETTSCTERAEGTGGKDSNRLSLTLPVLSLDPAVALAFRSPREPCP